MKQYLEYMKNTVSTCVINGDCGLYLPTQHPWLAITPDGLVRDPRITPLRGLVEYKNPHA